VGVAVGETDAATLNDDEEEGEPDMDSVRLLDTLTEAEWDGVGVMVHDFDSG
jgi:hypothetical protein